MHQTYLLEMRIQNSLFVESSGCLVVSTEELNITTAFAPEQLFSVDLLANAQIFSNGA